MVPDFRALDIRLVDELPPGMRKACVYPDGRIEVDRLEWERWSAPQKAACIAHEVGHQIGATCGRCDGSRDCYQCERAADVAAGFVLREWGFTRAASTSALASIISTRPSAARDAASGYDARSLDSVVTLASPMRARAGAIVQPQPASSNIVSLGQTATASAPSAPIVTPEQTATAAGPPSAAPESSAQGTVNFTTPEAVAAANREALVKEVVVGVFVSLIVLALVS